MVLPPNEASLKALLANKLLADTDAQVRMAALLATAELPASDAAGTAIYAALQDSRTADDRWIPDAATAAAARNDAGFLKAVLASYRPGTNQAANTLAEADILFFTGSHQLYCLS